MEGNGVAADYRAFLDSKMDFGASHGFEPIEIPDFLKDFQRFFVDWALRRGRAALYEDCGMGKSPQELVWADNVVRHTNRNVLLLTPLGVTGQMLREANKFGIDAELCRDGKFTKKIIISNYEQINKFSPLDFAGFIGDESQIIKNFNGRTKAEVTEFMRTIPYRLLCTATPAPNDYPELGTSAEALGEMGYQDMLTMFFRNETTKEREFYVKGWARQKQWILRKYAERNFWRWICSWARAARKPSDVGFSDDGYILPGLTVDEHVVTARTKRDGFLLDMPAITLDEQREERRRTIQERCERIVELVNHDQPAIVWCHLNDEGDLLAKLIKDSIQVSGSDSDESKEDAFAAFSSGQVRVLVSKPRIAGYGLNFQHCAHQTFFPSHSYQEWYQSVRRSYRFGQRRVVKVDIVASEGESGVVANLQQKADAADMMFSKLVELMNDQLHLKRVDPFVKTVDVPPWL